MFEISKEFSSIYWLLEGHSLRTEETSSSYPDDIGRGFMANYDWSSMESAPVSLLPKADVTRLDFSNSSLKEIVQRF